MNLSRYEERLESERETYLPDILKRLEEWRIDADLVGIREDTALANLPEEEATACRKLWSDVAALLEQARAAGKTSN